MVCGGDCGGGCVAVDGDGDDGWVGRVRGCARAGLLDEEEEDVEDVMVAPDVVLMVVVGDDDDAFAGVMGGLADQVCMLRLEGRCVNVVVIVGLQNSFDQLCQCGPERDEAVVMLMRAMVRVSCRSELWLAGISAPAAVPRQTSIKHAVPRRSHKGT